MAQSDHFEHTTFIFSGKPLKYSRIDEPLYQLDEGNLSEHYRFKILMRKNFQIAQCINFSLQYSNK